MVMFRNSKHLLFHSVEFDDEKALGTFFSLNKNGAKRKIQNDSPYYSTIIYATAIETNAELLFIM